jgi:hypothetical protein
MAFYMGAEKNNSKANGQVLRDKLNQTLKQRLGRKTDAAKPLAEREPSSSESPSTPALDARGKPISRDRQFLDELESDALHEVGLMDRIGMFSAQNNGAKPLAKNAAEQKSSTVLPPADPTALASSTEPWPPQPSAPSQNSLHSAPEPTEPSRPKAEAHQRRSESEGPAPMTDQEAHKRPPVTQDTQPSLMDLLKTSKPESKNGTALKAPRQNAQNNLLLAVEPVSVSTSTATKNSFLKAPRQGSQNSLATAEEPMNFTEQETTHEQQIVEAIKRGDKAWIEANATMDGIPLGRQEMLLVFAFAKPECIFPLLAAGLKFDPKEGLAIRNALSRKNYAALECLKARGANIDLETLKAIASWRRNQNKELSKPGKPEPEPDQDIVNTARIQEDFDDFLRTHASEIDQDDLAAFSAPPPMHKDHADAALDAPHEDETSIIETLAVAEPQQHESAGQPSTDLDSTFRDAFEEMQQTLHRLDEAEAPVAPSLDTNPQTISPAPAIEPEIGDSKQTDMISAIASIAAPVSEPNDPEPDAMQNPSTIETRKPHSSLGSGPSAMDRARLAMLDKVLLEKQQLEVKVMELQMFEEAATSLEDERNRLLDELAEAQDNQELLSNKLAQARQDYAQFDKIKAQLENALAQQIEQQNQLTQSHLKEQERLTQAEANLSTLLKEHERRETELRTHNGQLAAKIAELENREAPAPDATDWLKDTEKEANLRRNLFIDTVIKGEYKLLDKVAKNTAVDSETAHWALVFAAESGRIRCAQWIVDNLDAHPGFGGEIALLRALDSKNMEMVRWLANHGADIHHAEEFALRHAVDHDDVSMLDFLVSMGANPRVARERPLREAAEKQSWSCFKALLGYGSTGHDDKGVLYPELAEQEEEVKPHLEWAAQQRKLARTLDPDFAKRQVRHEH